MWRRSYPSCALTDNCDGSTGSTVPLYECLLRFGRFPRIALFSVHHQNLQSCYYMFVVNSPGVPSDTLVVDKSGPGIMVQGRWPPQPLDQCFGTTPDNGDLVDTLCDRWKRML